MGRERIPVGVRDDELTEERAEELGRCYDSYIHFIENYCYIYDSVEMRWIPFRLWDAQKSLLHDIHNHQLTVILKARQLGISWLSLCYGLWQFLFRPIASISVFSRRETEAIYLLGQERLRGIFHHLPLWMISGHEPSKYTEREWILTTGSAMRAFPTSAGDSYVSTLAIVDEADLTPDLNEMMRAVKPTIEMGGKFILLSRSNKSQPDSEFKRIYKAAKAGESPWYPVFLPWMAHPVRDRAWYNEQKRDITSRTGSVDDLYEQYPETDVQALAAKILDKRIPPMWLEVCFEKLKPLYVKSGPAIPLDIYIPPKASGRYVLGADPAEGNPNSDDSALTVIDIDKGEECAILVGKFEPAIFAHYIHQVSVYYNYSPAMVERNNHGHSVIQWLEEHGRRTRLLLGHDSESHKFDKKNQKRRKKLKAGWLSSTLGKAILYTTCANHFRDNANLDDIDAEGVKVLHTEQTLFQLQGIEVDTLRAPDGENDDRADSYALAIAGRDQIRKLGHSAGTEMGIVKGKS